MSSNQPVREYDANNNLIHVKDSDGRERWWEYDSNGKIIHFKDSDGWEQWREYDSNGKYIHFKNNDGLEGWYWEGKPTTDPIKILLLSSQIHSEIPQ